MVEDHGPEHLSQPAKPPEFPVPLPRPQSESGWEPCRDLSVLLLVRQASLGAVHAGRMAGQRCASRAEWKPGCDTRGFQYLGRERHAPFQSTFGKCNL